MKISIKEIKVEHDGSELLYVRDIGFIVKSDTFSGAVKECQKQLRQKEEQERKTDKKERSQTVPIEDLIPVLSQMFSQWFKSKEGDDKSEPGNIEPEIKPEEPKKEPGQ